MYIILKTFPVQAQNNIVKIGISKHPLKRVKQLQTGTSDRLYLYKWFDVVNPKKLEKYVHKLLWKHRIHPLGEWFKLSKELIDFIEFEVIPLWLTFPQ